MTLFQIDMLWQAQRFIRRLRLRILTDVIVVDADSDRQYLILVGKISDGNSLPLYCFLYESFSKEMDLQDTI